MVIEINDSNFEQKINEIKGKVLVDCYANWCGPCKMLSPIIDEVAKNTDTCTFYKLDVDVNEDVASKYNIMTIPTLLLFEDGVLLKQTSGFISEDDLLEFIK